MKTKNNHLCGGSMSRPPKAPWTANSLGKKKEQVAKMLCFLSPGSVKVRCKYGTHLLFLWSQYSWLWVFQDPVSPLVWGAPYPPTHTRLGRDQPPQSPFPSATEVIQWVDHSSRSTHWSPALDFRHMGSERENTPGSLGSSSGQWMPGPLPVLLPSHRGSSLLSVWPGPAASPRYWMETGTPDPAEPESTF